MGKGRPDSFGSGSPITKQWLFGESQVCDFQPAKSVCIFVHLWFLLHGWGRVSMKLAIIGTGYVGLVTGTCFAEVGHRVICVDNDAAKVKLLQDGGIPIYEPGLEELVKNNVAAGRLSFTNSTAEGVEKSDVVFIAVPTPPLDDGAVDLSFIEK